MGSHAPPLSLASLPVELHALIVKHAHALDLTAYRYDNPTKKIVTREIVYENYHQHGLKPSPRLPTIEALSRVNSHFCELCGPYLWERVDLTTANEADLEYFVQFIVPRHMHHMQSIAHHYHNVVPEEDEDVEYRESTPQYITSALSAPPRERRMFLPLLLSPSALPKLAKIDVYFGSEKAKEEFGRVSKNFLERKSDLTGLELYWHHAAEQSMSTGDFATFLSHFRQLTKLTLSQIPIDGSLMLDLVAILLHLEALEELSLIGLDWIDGRLAEMKWTCHLTELCLENLDSFKISHAAELVDKMKDSLQVLSLIDLDAATPSFESAYSGTLIPLQEAFRNSATQIA